MDSKRVKAEELNSGDIVRDYKNGHRASVHLVVAVKDGSLVYLTDSITDERSCRFMPKGSGLVRFSA